MPVVLLHCWPFTRECGWLAWTHPNVYADACWLGVLNPAYLREALATWIGLVPSHKIMCGHDATSIEMAAGSVTAVRQALGEVLGDQCRYGAFAEGRSREIAADIMSRNAERLYGVRPA
jgi:predicted TIM-barrel fold metal-dependent hydrolase